MKVVECIVNLNWGNIYLLFKGVGKGNYFIVVIEVDNCIVEIIDVEKILFEVFLFEEIIFD